MIMHVVIILSFSSSTSTNSGFARRVLHGWKHRIRIQLQKDIHLVDAFHEGLYSRMLFTVILC